MSIYSALCADLSSGRKKLALLIDPDKTDAQGCIRLLERLSDRLPDYFLVGSSLLCESHLHEVVGTLKAYCQVPVLLFPGHYAHLSGEADGLLLLSLISGRNPDLLIGQHVMAAASIRRSGLDTIPTGYMLIDGGAPTSVSYMSNTLPIPSGKADIAVATAMAGELLGLRCLYLEAGSGALRPVPESLIAKVRQAVDIPLIVGGGIRSVQQAEAALRAGADMLVVGTAIEQDPDFGRELHALFQDFIQA